MKSGTTTSEASSKGSGCLGQTWAVDQKPNDEDFSRGKSIDAPTRRESKRRWKDLGTSLSRRKELGRSALSIVAFAPIISRRRPGGCPSLVTRDQPSRKA